MATFFGEIVSVRSRAVDEVEDDENDADEDEDILKELDESRSALCCLDGRLCATCWEEDNHTAPGGEFRFRFMLANKIR